MSRTAEHLTIRVGADRASQYQDAYLAFGWAPVDRRPTPLRRTLLSFRRDRPVPHRWLVAALQRQATTALHRIDLLERRPRAQALAAELIGAITAVALAAGAVLLCRRDAWVPGLVLAALAEGVAALARCGTEQVRRWGSRRVAVELDRERDLVQLSCAQAVHLIGDVG